MMEQRAKRPNEDYVIAAEYRLLNATIHTKGYLEDSRVHEGILPHAVARSIFRSICELVAEGTPVTEASLFQRANEMDFNVTVDVINQVYSISDGAEKLDDILKTLYKQKRKMDVIERLNKALTVANAKGEMNIEEISVALYEAEEVLSDSYDKQILQDFDAWFEKYEQDLSERAAGRKYSFGDQFMDGALVKGAYPGAITTIAGATGQGKSAFVLNLISQMINMGIPCMYISLEMSGIDTMDRFVSMRAEIPTTELYNQDAIPAVRKAVAEMRQQLASNNLFYFVDEPNLSLAQVQSLIKEFKQRTRSDYVIVAIDLVTQLQEFTRTGTGMNLANAYEMAMNKENIIAKAQNCHFLNVVQFSRNADNFRISEFKDLENAALRPNLNDIKNAGAIAERSRAVLGLFRPKYYADRYLPDDPAVEYMEDILEVQVLKQSNGSTPRLKYMYEGEIFRVNPFEEATNETPEEAEIRKVAENRIGNF
jgi:replicative DNA helicase